MKIIQVHETGDLDALKLETVPSPTPGDGELRIRVRACGINFADMLLFVSCIFGSAVAGRRRRMQQP